MPSFALTRRYGASKIIATMYRHGAPPTLSALAALLNEDHEEEKWRVYVADMVCAIARKMIRKSTFPFYSEMVRKQKAQTDSRRGREIVDDLIAKRRRKRLREAKHETI